MESETVVREGRLSRRTWVLIVLALLLLLGANAHLVYVSIVSSPDCVAHLKVPDETGSSYRAARSSC